MLSEDERRELSGIERDLARRDPALARRLRRSARSRRRPSWRAVLATIGVAIAVALIPLGLVGHALVVLAVLGWPLAWQRSRRAGPNTTRTDPPHP